MMLLYGSSFVFAMNELNSVSARLASMQLYGNQVLSGKFVTTLAILALLAIGGATRAEGQATIPGNTSDQPQLVWVDTDIGDDLDDAFALGLILRSPELHVLGISTAFGDTEARARLMDRFLAATSWSAIPVTAGVHTAADNVMTQRIYAERYPAHEHPDGVQVLLDEIKRHPGEITLIAIGPLFNVGAAIDRDPETFRKLRRVVMMGGSIDRGYDGQNGESRPPDAEWNIKCDPKGAAKLLAAGVPIFMMPLDSTQIHLGAEARETIFATDNPLTDQLTLLYHQWAAHSWNHSPTPTLFDPVAAAYTFRPDLCPMQPMRLEVDDKGFTRKAEGQPNAQVCLKSNEDGFKKLLLERLNAAGK
jgi:inosine-uridine nucleoside N-ribohydrolase